MFELLMAGVIAGAMAGPAHADAGPLRIGACDEASRSGDTWTMECGVRNAGPVAAARLTGRTALKDPGRTVPWASEAFDLAVPGGIEPGETRRLTLPHPDPSVVPDGFAPRSLVLDLDGVTLDGRSIGELTELRQAALERAQARRKRAEQAAAEAQAADDPHPGGSSFDDPVADALERALDLTAPNPGPPMTGAEQHAFQVAVQQCWNVDVGSEAARVTLTVEFDLDPKGRIEGDVRKVAAAGGGEWAIEAAFQSARRAILRCQRNGYPLPADKYEQWRTLEMTFDPSGLRLH